MHPAERPPGPSRRRVLRGVLALGAAPFAAAACGRDPDPAPAEPTGDPLAPPRPVRTVDPSSPVSRLVTLSSADLDVAHALGLPVAAAWAADGAGPRPWRAAPAPTPVDWTGEGLPDLRSLLPAAPGALLCAAADPSTDQLRAYERLAPVVCGDSGYPAWDEHVRLVAEAAGRRPDDAVRVTTTALDAWASARRRDGCRSLAVVLATGAGDGTPVATLAADAPFARRVAALGFDVVAHPEAVEYGRLRGPGVLVVRVDPGDADMVAAVRQPSTLSLPWALDVLARGRRPGR